MPRSAVVVVNYGSHAMLAAHLAPLEAELDVVVVDSFSSAAEAAAVRRVCDAHGWTLVAPGTNVGFGVGCNLGAQTALDRGAEALLFLNPDARIDLAGARTLLSAAHADPCLLVAPRIDRPDGSAWFRGATLDLRTGVTSSRLPGPQEHEVLWLTGACLAVSAAGWRARGGFDRTYFLYWEDIELSRRWCRDGGRVAVDATVTCVHDVGGTQGGAKSPAYYYYNCRNRLLFAATHLPRRTRGRWAWHAPAYAQRVLLRGGRRQLLHPGTCVVPVARGTLAGLAALVRGAAAH